MRSIGCRPEASRLARKPACSTSAAAGYPGQLCREAGAQVVFADFEDLRLDTLKEAPFRQIDLNKPTSLIMANTIW